MVHIKPTGICLTIFTNNIWSYKLYPPYAPRNSTTTTTTMNTYMNLLQSSLLFFCRKTNLNLPQLRTEQRAAHIRYTRSRTRARINNTCAGLCGFHNKHSGSARSLCDVTLVGARASSSASTRSYLLAIDSSSSSSSSRGGDRVGGSGGRVGRVHKNQHHRARMINRGNRGGGSSATTGRSS